jgi:nicotinamidase/pyrazinamidase
MKKIKVIIDERQYVASFDVHAQNTFTPLCEDELPVAGGNEIVHELNEQAKLAAVRIGSKEAHSRHAVWVATDQHPQYTPIKGENVDVRWKPHSMPGTKGFELISGLPRVAEYDYFVWEGIELDMHPYGACYHDFAEKLSTGAIEFLRAHQITTVIVGGLATDYCVKATVIQLLHAKFKVVVNLAACRGFAKETTESAKAEMVVNGAILADESSQIAYASSVDIHTL